MDEWKPLSCGATMCAVSRGRAVQVDPMKPKFKPPGTKRLKLECDILLSASAFKFNLRRYTRGRTLARGWAVQVILVAPKLAY
jgi:hypothetical protein